MPFQGILRELLQSTDGSIGAMFLDYEGETVELVSLRDLKKDDLKIVGAYQGIFLTQLRHLCEEMTIGIPHRFKIEFAQTRVLSADLKDGYYVVLLIGQEALEGVAWRTLERCRERLIEEM